MANMEYKCQYCGKMCKNANSLRNHERLCKSNLNHQEHTGFISGWNKGLTKKTDERVKHISEGLQKRYLYLKKPYYCEICGKLVIKKYGSGRFCSSECANRRQHSEKTKEKIRLGLFKYNLKKENNLSKEALHKKYFRKCIICGKEFNVQRTNSGNFSKAKTCSEECSLKLRSKNSSESTRNLIIQGRHVGWTTRNIESYAEKFFKKVLENNSIKYEFNKPIRKLDLGTQENGCYFLDFALSNKIDLEIDGKQHELEDRKEHDRVRDERLMKVGYKVYRIKWKNLPKYNDYIKDEIDKFLKWYNENK